MKLPTPIPTFAADAPLPRSMMTRAERARGRFMRAPDGHDGAGGAAVADPAPAAAAAAAGNGADAGAGGQGGGDGNDGGDDNTFLGGAGGDAGKGGEGAEGASDKGEAGEGGDAEIPAGAPEKYELTAPEGFEALDPEMLDAADPVLRDLKLSNEDAQKLMPIAGQLVQRATDRAMQGIAAHAATQRKEWADAFEADPEIGGPRKAETESLAARAFDHYGLKAGEGLRQLLDESGIGNHPDLIRFVAGVGRDLGEGNFERGDVAPTKRSREEILYPNDVKTSE